MKQKTIITMPAPCAEGWEGMNPVKEGRHCASCNKVVTDFTRYTDQQLLDFITAKKGQHFCGHYRTDQLNRPLTPITLRRFPGFLLQRMAAAFLVATSFVSSAVAQNRKLTPGTSQHSFSSSRVVTIRGRVVDQNSGVALVGVTVRDSTGLSTTTGDNGRFELTLPKGYTSDTVFLTVTDTTATADKAYEFERPGLSILSKEEIVIYRRPAQVLPQVAPAVEVFHLDPNTIITTTGGAPVMFVQQNPLISIPSYIVKPVRYKKRLKRKHK